MRDPTRSARAFYGMSARGGSGSTITLNPALITLLDGRDTALPLALRQQRVMDSARALVKHGIRTLHVDVICGDYGGFDVPPPRTDAIFSPTWVTELVWMAAEYEAFVNVHLLTDNIARQLGAYAHTGIGAVCFQLDAVSDRTALRALIDAIHAMDAAVSPVIETVGTSVRPAATPEQVAHWLQPVLTEIEMLTIQAATTAARSNQPGVHLDQNRIRSYLYPLRDGFGGTVQIQGGITTDTVCQAVQTGATFLVAGTQIFHSNRTPEAMIDALLTKAATCVDGHA